MSSQEKDAGAQTPTILVVDDNAQDREVLGALLRMAGYRPATVRDGQEALTYVQQDLPDLVIVDAAMPTMDGFDLCRRLRTLEHTSFLPVILISAVHVNTADRVRGLEVGADDFMLKPANREMLRARIESLLRLKSVREELQTERNRLRTLNYAAARLMASSDLRDLSHTALTAAMDVAGSDQAALFLLNNTGQLLRLVAAQGLSAAYQQAFRTLRVGSDPRTIAILEGTHLLPDVQGGLAPAYEEFAAQEGFRAVAEIPLSGAERVLGILSLYYAAPHTFREGEVDILVAMANQIAVSIERSRRFVLEQRRRQIAEALQRVAQTINASLDPSQVLPMILRQLQAVVPYHSGLVLLRTGGELEVAAAQGEVDAALVEGQMLVLEDYPFLGEALVAGRPLVIPQMSKDKRASGLPGGQKQGAWLAAPLVSRGETMGLLLVISTNEGAYGSGTVEIAQGFARQAAIAVENAQLFQQAQEERHKLEAILDQTTEAVLAVDEQGCILLANPAAHRLLDLPAGKIQGRELVNALPHEALLALFDQAVHGLAVTAEIRGRNGRQLYASVSPVAGVGQVAVVRDISPLKELEMMRLQAEQSERERLRRTLECYVGPELVEQVLRERGNLLERRARVEAVILFADIRGFTTAAATLPPETAVEVLNDFFAAMTRVVYQCQGTVVDFIGDELMASFGAPLPQSDAAFRAVEAAIALQMDFTNLHAEWFEPVSYTHLTLPTN